MVKILFPVKHRQPEDVPFEKSKSTKDIPTIKYQNVGHLTAIVISICFSTFYYGLCLSMSSAVPAKIYKAYFGEWAAETQTQGLLIGFFPIGGAIGAVCARFFIKYFTRKQILIILDIFGLIVTGLLMIQNIGLLLALRIMQGIIVGIYMAVVSLYICEVTPFDLHGSQGVWSQILIVLGVVLCYVFKVAFTQQGVGYEFYWRFVFLFSGLPCLLQLICNVIGFIPESPMSLINKGKMSEAREIIAKFNIPQVVDDVLAEMVRKAKQKQLTKIAKTHGITARISRQENQRAASNHNLMLTASRQLIQNPTAPTNPLDSSADIIKNQDGEPRQAQRIPTQRVLNSIIEMYDKEKNLQPEVKRILSEHHLKVEPVPHVPEKVPLKGIFLGFELHFMQQFSGTKMVVTQTGILFSGYNASLTLWSPLIANIVQFTATCCSMWVLSRFGRRAPTIIGNLALSIITFTLGILFVINVSTHAIGLIYAAFVMINLFMVTYSLSLGPVVWPYVPELMPAEYVPYASSMNWIAAAICVIATPYILTAVGSPYPVFFFFGGIELIFFIINKKYLIQTKGLTHNEIVAKLSK